MGSASPYAPPATRTVGDRGFRGMDASKDIWALEPGYCNYIQNGILRRDGSIISRSGFAGVFDTPLPDPIGEMAAVTTDFQPYIVFVSGGKLYSWAVQASSDPVELTYGSSTSFAFPDDGAGVRFARFGKWVYGVPGPAGGDIFRTDGVEAQLLTPAFSFTSTLPSITIPTASLPSGSIGLGWSETTYIGASVGEQNFSTDGSTLNTKWNTSGSPSIANYLDANSERCIELDNDGGAESVYTDPTGGNQQISEGIASQTLFATKNHLFEVEFEAAAEDSEKATPAIDKTSPWAYVDVTITPYSDAAGTSAISGGAITLRSGPHAEQTSTKERLVFDFRGVEARPARPQWCASSKRTTTSTSSTPGA